jgi:hypothetical protein
MIEDVFAVIEPVLQALGAVEEEGEEYRTPQLDVLRYYRRPVRLHWLPWVGRAWGVTAVVRQPMDLGIKIGGGYTALLDRVARAVHSRFPPGRDRRWGTVGLTVIVLTPEPIGHEDDASLQKALAPSRRTRVVTLGVLRLNLGQGAMAMALTSTPDRLFPEPIELADSLTAKYRRFVPLMEL